MFVRTLGLLLAVALVPSLATAEQPDEPGIAPRHEAEKGLRHVPPRKQPKKPPPKPQPFPKHSMTAGLTLSMGIGSNNYAFALGGNFGYFVLPGLEPGIYLDVSFGSEPQATVISLMPYLRWVFWRRYPLSPYLKVQGGNWFVVNRPDYGVFGGGGGVVYFITRWAGIQVEGMVLQLFPQGGWPCPNDNCTIPSFGFSFGFFFGAGMKSVGR